MSSSCQTYVGPFLLVSGPRVQVPDELEHLAFSPDVSLDGQQVLLPNQLSMPGKTFDRNSEAGVFLPNPKGETSALLAAMRPVLAYLEKQPGVRVTPQWGVVTRWA